MEIKLGERYTLAPLRWERDFIDNECETLTVWRASTVFCELTVEHCIEKQPDDGEGPYDHGVRFSYCVDEYYDEGSEIVESIDAGKTRAEQWYVDRIKAAFVDAADQPGEDQ